MLNVITILRKCFSIFLCFVATSAPAYALDSEQQFLWSCGQKDPYLRDSKCPPLEESEGSNGGSGSGSGSGLALGAIVGILALGYIAKSMKDNADEKQREILAMNFGRDLVNTGGNWHVVDVDRGKNLNLFSKPSLRMRDNPMLAIIPSDTKHISLAGDCTEEFCPIHLNTEQNGGIGWVSRFHIKQFANVYSPSETKNSSWGWPQRQSVPDPAPSDETWRVKAGQVVRLKAGPSPNSPQLAAFTDRTRNIRLTGKCRGVMCPVMVYGSTDTMTGWMHGDGIERN